MANSTLSQAFRKRSPHQKLVDEFLEGYGLDVPNKPQVCNKEALVTQGRLAIEELWEYFEAAGIDVYVNDAKGRPIKVGYTDFMLGKTRGETDLEGIADAWADVIFVATGGLSLCGISDISLLEEVDYNNLEKIEKGHIDHETGKFMKAEDHVPPDIAAVLVRQGWTAPVVEETDNADADKDDEPS